MKYLPIAMILILAGCATTNQRTTSATDLMQLIEQTAEIAPKGVEGTFEIPIKAAGQQGGRVFLNSELDYRDRRCVTVALMPHVAAEFTVRTGQPPLEYFLNKSIKVNGIAKQEKIWFIANGKRTEAYYYQTHIKVNNIDQIQVLDQ